MGPYTCTHENCGRRTDNDSHLCDEHETKAEAEDRVEGKPLPHDFYAYEDHCDRRDYREERK